MVRVGNKREREFQEMRSELGGRVGKAGHFRSCR